MSRITPSAGMLRALIATPETMREALPYLEHGRPLPPVRIVSPDDAEKADAVICNRLGEPSPFADNVLATCADCTTPIYHRPTAPKRPPKLCMRCGVRRLAAK